MIGRHVLTLRALRDLETIWDDTAERWGHHQAEDYIRQLWRHIELVAARPDLGRSCPEIRTGYSKFPSGSHVLFYRRSPDGIVIVRILHERMDFIQHI
jgi:toxin ParE1/3/4